MITLFAAAVRAVSVGLLALSLFVHDAGAVKVSAHALRAASAVGFRGVSLAARGLALAGRTLPLALQVMSVAATEPAARGTAAVTTEPAAHSPADVTTGPTSRTHRAGAARQPAVAARSAASPPADSVVHPAAGITDMPAAGATARPAPGSARAGSDEPGSKASAQAGGGRSGSRSTAAKGTAGQAQVTGPDEEEKPEEDEDKSEEATGHLRRSNAPTVELGRSEVVVAEDEYHRDDLICIGGRVTVRGEVGGDIIVVGGVLTLTGKVHGQVVTVVSRVDLGSGAHIRGDFVNIGGALERAPGVIIEGEYTSIPLPFIGRLATGRGAARYLLAILFWFVVMATAVRFLAVLVVAAVAPARVEGALASPSPSWILAFFLGLLVYLFGQLLMLILCALFPLGIAFWIALHVAIWMGLASVYLQVGRSIGRSLFGKELSYFASILTGFTLFGVIGLIPCFGWVFNAMVSVTGLGLMLLTRFGGRRRGAPAPGPSSASPGAPAASDLPGTPGTGVEGMPPAPGSPPPPS